VLVDEHLNEQINEHVNEQVFVTRAGQPVEGVVEIGLRRLERSVLGVAARWDPQSHAGD